METAPNAGEVRPRPSSLKTIGILNIVFGSILLLCLPCGYSYLALVANAGRFVEFQNQQMKQLAETRKKEGLDRLAAEEARATTPEEKARIRAERLKVEFAVAPVAPTNPAIIDFATSGFRDPRVVTYYAIEFATALALNVAMIVAGIGLVRYRSWGRTFGVWVAGVKLARLAVVAILAFALVQPILDQAMQDALRKNPAVGPDVEALAKMETARGPARAYKLVFILGINALGMIYPAVALWFLTRPEARAACRSRKPEPTDWDDR
jgi:hypothetical protein